MRNLPTLLLTLALVMPMAAGAQDDGDATATVESTPAAVGPSVVEQNNKRDPAEIEAYKAVQKRFSERAIEFESDVKRYLATRKAEELGRISDGYDALVQSLEEKERAQRDLAIDRLREFLVRYPGVPDSDNVRFRLAELYYEKAVEQWLDAQATFEDRATEYDRLAEEAEAALEAGDPSLWENLQPLEFPKKDLERSLALYQTIIARNEPLAAEDRWVHLDRAYYSLGFSFMDTESQQHDFLKARKAFQELIRVAGEDSDLADAAHMFLGKLLFENEKEFDAALAEYAAVVEKGPKSDYYYDGMFQLAWTTYKLAGKDPEVYEPRALELFTKLLDDSERTFRESGKESDYAPDARLNLARTLADVGERTMGTSNELTPVEASERYFSDLGGRPWERAVYESLAEVLAGCVPVPDACAPGTQNGGRYEFDSAIAVYEKLQVDPRWVKAPDNPIFQRKLIYLLPQKLDADLDRDLPIEQKNMVDRYGETLIDPYTGQTQPNPWWVANRNNPDALDTVREFIEGSLSQVAIGLMQEAQRDDDPAKYRAASLKFREYLDKFPIADNFFQSQWYLANALLTSQPKEGDAPWGSYEEALREFTSLVETRSGHPYGDGALFGVMTARKELIAAKGDIYGPLDQLPNSAEVESTMTTDGGQEIKVYALPDDHKALIASMDLLTNHTFSEPTEEGLPNYADAYEDNKWFLNYTPALIYWKHNRFDQARERAEALLTIGEADIAARCDVEEIEFAATILADINKQEGDLVALSATSKRLDAMFRQCDPDNEKWDDIGKSAEFLLCQQLKDQGERLDAAQCFEQYFDAQECGTPAKRDNEKCKFAAYNAPNNYEIVGRAEKANELFEKYVDLYPRDELSRPLFLRIASNYEATFELDKAIAYYERLIANDPRGEYEGTPDAVYNTAFLRIGLGDHRGAAKGFEAYAKTYRDKDDAEGVMFRAGEQWELVSDRDALKFYDRFLAQYGPNKANSNPSHVIEAMYRVAQLQKGNERNYNRAMDDLVATFDRYQEAGTVLNSVANRYAAGHSFGKLQADYAILIQDTLSGNSDKDNALLETKDAVEIPAFEAKARQQLQKYKDFEYGTGAFFLMGSAKLYIAELIYGMQCPQTDEEFCDVWWELYEESWRPLAEEFETVGRDRLQALIDQGKAQKQHSEWIDKAYNTLNKLDPFKYPSVKDEVRGDTKLRALPTVRPLDISKTKPKKGEGSE